MSVTVNITVEDVNTKMDTYESIQLYSAATISGSYSLIATLTLVADDIYYSYVDTSGDITTWYKYRFFHTTGSVASNYSNPFNVTGLTRKLIRQRALIDYKAGMVTVAGAGTLSATVLQSDDYRIKTSFFATGRGAGSWTHPTSGSRAGQTRRALATSAPSTGSFTVNPAMTGALAAGDEFEWHWLADPDSWNEAINRGLSRYWYLDRVALVGNDEAEQSLAHLSWLTKKSSITGLWYYPWDATHEERAWGSSGQWWSARQENGYVTLMTRPAISSDATVYLEALRQMPPVYLDTDVLPVQCDVELAAAFAYDELLTTLITSNAAALAAADVSRLKTNQRDLRANRLLMLVKRNTPNPRRQPSQLQAPVSVSHPWSAR